jgi:hypothetical protein
MNAIFTSLCIVLCAVSIVHSPTYGAVQLAERNVTTQIQPKYKLDSISSQSDDDDDDGDDGDDDGGSNDNNNDNRCDLIEDKMKQKLNSFESRLLDIVKWRDNTEKDVAEWIAQLDMWKTSK